MNQGWVYREQVSKGGAGQTLLAYYTQRYRHSGEAEWRSRILSHQVLLDNQPAQPDAVLKRGQRLAYHRPPWQEPDVPLSFEVIHEDADLLAIAKPSGLPVMPGAGFLENTLLRQLKQHYPTETPVPIHRLGRGTSGLVLLGRSPLAKSELTRQMRDRKVHKVYRALAAGTDMPDEFVIKTAIGKIPHPTMGYLYGAVAENDPSASFAHSECKVFKGDAKATLVEVTILTGRPHQIRIHLAAAGYPLVGDPLYGIGGVPKLTLNPITGKLPVPGDCGYWLHAFQLGCIHPRSGDPLKLVASPPATLCERLSASALPDASGRDSNPVS